MRAGRRGPHPREQLQGRQQMHRGPEHQGQRAGQGGRRREGGGGCVGRRQGPCPRARRGKPEADRSGHRGLPQQPGHPCHQVSDDQLGAFIITIDQSQGVGRGQRQWPGLCLREPGQGQPQAHVPRVQVPGPRQDHRQRPQRHLQEDSHRAQPGSELKQTHRQADLSVRATREDGDGEADQPQCGGQAEQAGEADLELGSDHLGDIPHPHGGAEEGDQGVVPGLHSGEAEDTV